MKNGCFLYHRHLAGNRRFTNVLTYTQDSAVCRTEGPVWHMDNTAVSFTCAQPHMKPQLYFRPSHEQGWSSDPGVNQLNSERGNLEGELTLALANGIHLSVPAIRAYYEILWAYKSSRSFTRSPPSIIYSVPSVSSVSQQAASSIFKVSFTAGAAWQNTTGSFSMVLTSFPDR